MIVLRTAKPKDAAGIARVHVASWRDAYPGMVPDRILTGLSEIRYAAMYRRMLAAEGPRQATVVAVDEQAGVVGFGGCGPAKGPHMGYESEVFTLYLDPDYRGLGLGRHVLSSCFRELAKRRFKTCVIWVLADNPSRFFYHAMGGAVIAQRAEPLWGTVLNQLAYGWPDIEAAVEAMEAQARS